MTSAFQKLLINAMLQIVFQNLFVTAPFQFLYDWSVSKNFVWLSKTSLAWQKWHSWNDIVITKKFCIEGFRYKKAFGIINKIKIKIFYFIADPNPDTSGIVVSIITMLSYDPIQYG